MADGTTLDPGVGGDKIATDDLGAVGKAQWVKLMDGTDGGTAVIPGDATNGLDVDVTRSALPTGAATSAKQPALGTAGTASTDVITVQGIAAGTVIPVSDGAGSLTVDNGGTFAVQADTELTTADLDSGAGTDTRAVVGLVVAKSGGAANVSASDPLPVVNSGTVNVQIQAGGVTKAEDVASADGDVGFPVLGVRNDSAAAKSGTDGDYTMVATDSAGRVGVTDLGGAISVDDNGGSLTVDNGGTFAVQIAANSSVNNAQVAGTATSVNSGTKDAGTQRVILASDQTVVPVSDNAGSLTVDASAATFGVNQAQVSGTAISVNSGAKDAGTQRVILASDQTVVPISDNSGSLTVDAPVGTPAFVRLSDGAAAITTLPVSLASLPTLAAGTNNIGDVDVLTLPGSLAGIADDAAFTVATSVVMPVGYLADQTATDSVNEGDIGAARMTLDRIQIVTAAPSADTAGWSTKNCTSGDGSTALTNTAQAVKASAGKLGGWFIYNPNATAAYVPIYNVASGSVTVGTTNPLMVLTIPATSAANLEMNTGVTFDTAIAVAAATTAAGNTAPGTALEANFFYV